MTPISRLLDVMARLRDPDHGCPWDVENPLVISEGANMLLPEPGSDSCEEPWIDGSHHGFL